MYKAAIFDLDGTLLDSLPSLALSCDEVLTELGYPTHKTDSYRQMVGRGIRHLVCEMLPETERESSFDKAFSLYGEAYLRNLYYKLDAYPGIIELLNELKKNDIKLAVHSNKAQQYVEEIIDKLLPGYFTIVIGGDGDRSYPLKPDPTVTLAIAESFKLHPDEVLFVGDSNIDIFTANNAQMTACGVSWGFRSRTELEEAGADYIVDEPAQILDLILNGD